MFLSLAAKQPYQPSLRRFSLWLFFFCIALNHFGAVAHAQTVERWTTERANEWQKKNGWLVGANYLPAYAINQLEMWQPDTFDIERIDLELGWAESLGFNSMRVFLHDLLWEQDSKGFLQRIEMFLACCQKHKIGVVMVPFDSVWDPNPVLGKQRAPAKGVHNSGWVQSPGAKVLGDPNKHESMKPYLQGLLRHFRNDSRIQMWDLVNEMDNDNANSYGRNHLKVELDNKAEMGVQFATKCFQWAREINPSQPLTSGVWIGHWEDESKFRPIEQLCLSQSDVITFHNYENADGLKHAIQSLKRFNRPIVCTEYMARGNNSYFDPNLRVMKDEGVGSHCWGFVAGKSQTIYPWDSWQKPYSSEPDLWFHDIFRTDGTPYRKGEVDYIRQVTGK